MDVSEELVKRFHQELEKWKKILGYGNRKMKDDFSWSLHREQLNGITYCEIL